MVCGDCSSFTIASLLNLRQRTCHRADELVSRRFVKQQQIRVQVLDGEVHRTFKRWYPGMQLVDEPSALAV
jgi:hypothetical protein